MSRVGGNKRRYGEVQPDVQKEIVEDHIRGVRGHGYLAIAKRHQLPVRTVQHVIARAKRAGGDPVAPRGHKKRKLNDVEAAKYCVRLWTKTQSPQTANCGRLCATKSRHAL